MTGSDSDSDRRSIPLDRYPDPAASFQFDGGEPIVRQVNPAFQERFGDPDLPTEMAKLFDRLGVDPIGDGTDLCVRVSDGERSSSTVPVTIAGEGDRTFLRVIHGDDGSTGFLLFSGSSPMDDATKDTATGDDSAAGPDDSPTAMVGAEQVASVISHDLRNPLDVAKARLRAGRETGNDRHFDHVATAHDRMERIINDVLTLARGRESVDPNDSVDLGAAVERAWQTVETENAILCVETELPTVIADRSRLERLLENLFRNAVEHGAVDERNATANCDATAGRDGLCVTIGRIAEDSTGVFVEDDGVGIQPADQPHVFEPGYSSRDGGTGLGLAIVDGIARGHGWCVSVTAGRNGGARFEITGLDIDDRSEDARSDDRSGDTVIDDLGGEGG